MRPETARAVHRVLHLFATSIVSFKTIRLGDVRTTLQTVAEKLTLVEKCSARIKLMPSGMDITATSQETGFQV